MWKKKHFERKKLQEQYVGKVVEENHIWKIVEIKTVELFVLCFVVWLS
jgi:hypothetical protein